MPASLTLWLWAAALLASARAMDYCPQFLNSSNACSCYSYIDGAMIECEGPDSTDAVEQLKLSNVKIRQLSISNADIIEIGPRAFRNLQIKNLVLDKNRIRKIHKDAFRGLEYSLLGLSVNENKLTEIPTDALANLVNLQTLSLKCNNIGNIYTTVFRNVSNLIELNLACNQICRINANAFDGIKKKLQSLILDQNCLQAVPAEAFRGFESILALHMQHNRIQSIKQLEFMNMLSLMMVRLSGNSIRAIHRQAFTNIPNLRYLYLDRNQLTSIEPNALQQFSGNSIRAIHRQAFTNILNLRYLYLDRNQLTSIEPNALQQFRFLEIVDLSYNNIAEIPAGAFSNMEHLMQLILDGNMIVDIQPGAFSGSPILLLMLGGNCLGSISQQTFQGLPFLRQLSLANNNLKQIQQFAFSHMANLQMLDLSGNMIDTVPLAAFGFNLQITILLKENPVVCTQGYHLIQAGQGIHLLGQEDKICKSEIRITEATCPKRKEVPPPPPCCSDPVPVKKKPLTLPSIDSTPQSLSKSNASQRPPTIETEIPEETETSEVISFDQTTTVPRRLNLERFWRLTRPPTIEATESPSAEPSPVTVQEQQASRVPEEAITTPPPRPEVTNAPTQRNQVVVIDGSALPSNVISAIQASGTLPPNLNQQPRPAQVGPVPNNTGPRLNIATAGQQGPITGPQLRVGPNGRPVLPVQGQVQQPPNQPRPVNFGPFQQGGGPTTVNNGPEGRIVPNPTFQRRPVNLPPGFRLRGISRGGQQPGQPRPQFVRMPDGSIRAINPQLLRRRPVGQFVPGSAAGPVGSVQRVTAGNERAPGNETEVDPGQTNFSPPVRGGQIPTHPQTDPRRVINPNPSFGPPIRGPVQGQRQGVPPGGIDPRQLAPGFRPIGNQQAPPNSREASTQQRPFPHSQQGSSREGHSVSPRVQRPVWPTSQGHPRATPTQSANTWSGTPRQVQHSNSPRPTPFQHSNGSPRPTPFQHSNSPRQTPFQHSNSPRPTPFQQTARQPDRRPPVEFSRDSPQGNQ